MDEPSRTTRAVALWWIVTVGYVAATTYAANWSTVAQFIANYPTLYLLGPWVVGALLWRTPWLALLHGLLLSLVLVLVFYVADDLSGPHPFDAGACRYWLQVALVSGPAFAAWGVVAARSRPVLRGLAIAALVVLMGVPLVEIYTVPSRMTPLDQVGLAVNHVVWAAASIVISHRYRRISQPTAQNHPHPVR